MRVLSLDWDYFIDATASERFALFPDGGNENMPQGIQNIIWNGHYLNHGNPELKQLKDIGIKQGELTALYRLLKHNVVEGFTDVVIADSHRHAYSAITEMADTLMPSVIELYNVDFHHDCYFSHEEDRPVDCGNWVYKLIKKYGDDLIVSWIRQPDSDPWKDGELWEMHLTDLSGRLFDLVVLCRSGMWSPPHLDQHFISLAKRLKRMAGREQCTVIDRHVMQSRYTKDFAAAVTELERVKKEATQNITKRGDKTNLTAPPMAAATMMAEMVKMTKEGGETGC